MVTHGGRTRPANWFTRAPKGYSAAEAATLTTAGLTAWRALVTEGALKAGETVLVLGTGGVSIFSAQLAKMMGATVIATSSSDEKLERISAVGADHTINYKRHEEWSRQVLDLTDGRGVDHVIEVGGPGTLPQSITACRIGGHIALIGVLTGLAGPVPTAALMGRQQKLQGLTVGSREQQIELVRALDATGLKPVIDRRSVGAVGPRLPIRRKRLSLWEDLHRHLNFDAAVGSRCLRPSLGRRVTVFKETRPCRIPSAFIACFVTPERFYRAFLDADAMAKWLPPNGFTGKVHHIEPRVGGSLQNVVHELHYGGSHSFGGKYLELVPNERIRHTDKFDDPNLPGEMQVTITSKQVVGRHRVRSFRRAFPTHPA